MEDSSRNIYSSGNAHGTVEKFRPYLSKTFLVLALLVIFSVFYFFFLSPPGSFPSGSVVMIPSGSSLQEVTNILYKNKIIRSPLVFRSLVIIFGGEKKVIAGDYLFSEPSGPARVAFRLVRGSFGMPAVRITVPEGWNVFDISAYLPTVIKEFDTKQFLFLAKKEEGYLFPDTYFVSPAADPADIVLRMKNNFSEQIVRVKEVKNYEKPLADVITMASIVEEEARTTESRRMVAGILWKRLALGMPLQVDSTFSYINGKTSTELTVADLKIDSPYNTYVYKGLPPTPISNPGLDAIRATVTPIESEYLYFLTSRDGTTMHYAKTFEEHKRNKERYLK